MWYEHTAPEPIHTDRNIIVSLNVSFVVHHDSAYPLAAADVKALSGIYPLTRVPLSTLPALKTIFRKNDISFELLDWDEVRPQLIEHFWEQVFSNEVLQDKVERGPTSKDGMSFKALVIDTPVSNVDDILADVRSKGLRRAVAEAAKAQQPARSPSTVSEEQIAFENLVTRLQRYVGQYSFRLNIRKVLKPEEGCVGYELTFKFDPSMPNHIQYGDEVPQSQDTILQLAPTYRIRFELTSITLDESRETRSIRLVTEEIVGAAWTPVGMPRTFPLKGVDRESVTNLIGFMINHFQ